MKKQPYVVNFFEDYEIFLAVNERLSELGFFWENGKAAFDKVLNAAYDKAQNIKSEYPVTFILINGTDEKRLYFTMFKYSLHHGLTPLIHLEDLYNKDIIKDLI